MGTFHLLSPCTVAYLECDRPDYDYGCRIGWAFFSTYILFSVPSLPYPAPMCQATTHFSHSLDNWLQLIHFDCIIVQIDQEMKMIIGKEVKSSFIGEWQKYVPAIIEYAKKSGKQNLRAKTFELDTGT